MKYILHLILLLCSLLCLIPLVIVISASLSDEAALSEYGYGFWPSKLSLSAYNYIFQQPEQILTSYGVTLLVTLTGTALSILIMSLLAYPISRKDFVWKRSISFYVFFTMLYSGGLVPTYIIVAQVLHLKDTIWVLILPYVVIPWFVLLLRTFFASIPDEIVESGKLDGLGEYRLFFQIVVPLSTPVLATISLFSTLNYWNDWFQALLYIDDRTLMPLQYLLYSVMTNADAVNSSMNSTTAAMPTETVKMATAVIAVGPILFAYLFFQKYFVRGLTVGAIKG